MSGAPIRVLVADDSAFMRRLIVSVLEANPGITVVGQARNGIETVALVKELRPDVLTLDVEMPEMNGIEALRHIMAECPVPTVMLSSLTQEGAHTTIECLALGAVDFVGKPSGLQSMTLDSVVDELLLKIKAASTAQIAFRTVLRTAGPTHQGVVRKGLVFIGSSTGGPKALLSVVPALPGDLGVPVVLVQHMPPGFTSSLARRLNADSALHVKEAAEGDVLTPNTALLAPGGLHMVFRPGGVVHLHEEPPRHGVRPCVDITLESLLPDYGRTIVGVILTGMGKDGASSMKQLFDSGGYTIAEAEETCVVYGMPRAAAEIGAVRRQVPLQDVPKEIITGVHKLATDVATTLERKAV
jgi:two-component system chemotaxis response regulator CheB